MKRLTLLAFSGLVAFSLVACGSKEHSEPASPAAVARQTSDPGKAVESFSAKLRDNNLLEAIQLSVPPAKLDQLRAEWKESMNKEPPSDEDKAEFEVMMKKLTAPDAEQVLFAELEPKLVQFENEMAAQLPMIVGMGQGFAIQAINDNADLTPTQKKQAVDMLGAVAGWVQTAKFTDRNLAKKGISIAVKTARDLDLQTLDQVRALDFDHAMGKAGVVFGGLKDILALYDFNINQALDSIKVTDVENTGAGEAKVKMTYNFLGKTLETESEMIEVDGRWYGKEGVEQIIKELSSSD